MTNDIEIGKCEGCSQIVYDVNMMTEDVKLKMKKYGVKLLLLIVKSRLSVFQTSHGYVEKICIIN
jgi:hypothetical protein